MSDRLEPIRDGCWLDWGGSGPPLHFAHSNAFYPNAVRKVRRQVPGARVEVFEGYGHCVPMETPQGVGETILRFAAEVMG